MLNSLKNFNFCLDFWGKINYNDCDSVILAVVHDKFRHIKLNNNNQIVYDIKSILEISDGKL